MFLDHLDTADTVFPLIANIVLPRICLYIHTLLNYILKVIPVRLYLGNSNTDCIEVYLG